MPRGMARVAIIGHLGRDPELKEVGDKDLASFSVAVSEKWRNKAGESQETTQWFKCNCWSGLSKTAMNYLHKGDPVYVEGRLSIRSYTGKDGVEKTSVEINVSDLNLLGSKNRNQGDGEQDAQTYVDVPPAAAPRQAAADVPVIDVNYDNDAGDDLPF